MLLLSLPLTPLIGVLFITLTKDMSLALKIKKIIALGISILTFIFSLIAFILFDFSTNFFQFVVEYHKISYFDFYLGIDGLSMYFVLLTTIIIPGSLLSNWKSIKDNVELYFITILLLETLLLTVFLVLDVFLFYILFESILPPLFILIGMFGSDNRIKASFYLFLYTLLGSLFLLLSILSMSSTMCTTDYDSLFKKNFIYVIQLLLFYGIFIAFAVKTPTIFLNTWLLKAHVESPLGGSIILAAIVLKLSLYGIFRLILAVLVKAFMVCTYIVFLIGVITIIYASLSTLRTIDVKELIAYSSVSHAAVYLVGVFSNCVQGIVGSISLGLAHGLVSPGLFICAGGILYDRAHTRLIALYKGMTQVMPLFAIIFFIFCLANCGVPLTLNFVGEFMSLFGVFVRSLLYGIIASLSIIFSAAYSMVLYQKIAFGGSYSQMFTTNIQDLVNREFSLVLPLVICTIICGVYPAFIIDGLNYQVSGLIVNSHDMSNGIIGNLDYSIGSVFVLISPILRLLKDKTAPGLEWALDNPPKPHAFTSLPLQSSSPNGENDPDSDLPDLIDVDSDSEDENSSDEERENVAAGVDIEDKVEDYESEPANVPNADDMLNSGESRPNKIKDEGDKLIDKAEETKNKLNDEIDYNRDNGNITDEKAGELKDRVNSTAIATINNIKEAVNVAVETIDDSSDTEQYRYNDDSWILPMIFFELPMLELPILRILGLLYTCYSSKLGFKADLWLCYYTVSSFIKNNYKVISISCVVLSLILLGFYLCNPINCDAPRAWGLYFQDSASPQMEALVELHDNIMYYLLAIFIVGLILGAIIKNFESSKSPISNKYLNHGTLIPWIWTITSALILVLIAFPSFKLLDLMDEVTDPSLSVLAEDHQWYWSYEYPEFLNGDEDFVQFDGDIVEFNIDYNHYSSQGGNGNQASNYNQSGNTNNSGDSNRCRHPIWARRQLTNLTWEFQNRFANIRCSGGYPIGAPGDHAPMSCDLCGKLFCAKGSCRCPSDP